MESTTAGTSLLLVGALVGISAGSQPVQAQIMPASNDTGTIVMPAGNQFDIRGGRLSGDGANLFHGFQQFGLSRGQIANFFSNPNIQNILVRVTGGESSRIDGILQITGGNSNLFLMNPAGIVFGANASLNVSGSFTATTANGIGFGANWFSASGPNNYEALMGTPGTFAFTMPQPGAIINAATLRVNSGNDLTLLGGTVLSTGSLIAHDGNITVAAVPGESVLQIREAGRLLNLEIQAAVAGNLPANWTLPILSLPQLLTGGVGSHARNLTINSIGEVVLTGSGVSVEAGDVLVQKAETLTRDSTLIGFANRLLPRFLAPTVVVTEPGGTIPIASPIPSSPILPLPVPVPPVISVPVPLTQPTTTPFECYQFCPGPPPGQGSLVGQGQGESSSNQPLQPNQPRTILLRLEPSSAVDANAPLKPSSAADANAPSASVSTTSTTTDLDPLLPVVKMQFPLVNQSTLSEADRPLPPSAIETVRQYFRQRWRRSPSLTENLQYRLVFNANGSLQEVIPLGKAATDQMQALGLSQVEGMIGGLFAAEQAMQMLVTLRPDGAVDVIPETLGLRK